MIYRGHGVSWAAAGRSGDVRDTSGEKATLSEALLDALDGIPQGRCIVLNTNKPYFGNLVLGEQKKALSGDEKRLLFRLMSYPRVRVGHS